MEGRHLPGHGIELPGAGRIEDYRVGIGKRVLAGVDGLMYAGEGQIHFYRPPRVGIDLALWAALKAAVDVLEIRLRVREIDAASVHVRNSRHYIGCAADIDLCAYMGDPWKTATLENGALLKLHGWYRKHGWAIGEPSGRPGLILGPVHTRFNPTGINHRTHMHVSVARPLTPGGTPMADPGWTDADICCGSEEEDGSEPYPE